MDSRYKKSKMLGIFLGFIGLVIGLLVGMGFVTLIRLLLGLPAWSPEPAWVLGGVFGTVGFMIGIGALTDWFKIAMGQEVNDHPGEDFSSRMEAIFQLYD